MTLRTRTASIGAMAKLVGVLAIGVVVIGWVGWVVSSPSLGQVADGAEHRPATTQPADTAISSASTQATQASSTSSKESANMVLVRVFQKDGQLSEPMLVPKVELSDDQWRQILTPQQFRILRAQGTEAAFCGGLLNEKGQGVYVCAGCGLPLFESNTKFHSGTGWPSFFQPIAKENIRELQDDSYGMVRIEIRCARCGGHLGHVFPDGPRPTGLRYCTNSESLRFVPQNQLASLAGK